MAFLFRSPLVLLFAFLVLALNGFVLQKTAIAAEIAAVPSFKNKDVPLPSVERMAGQMVLAGFHASGDEPLTPDVTYLLEDIYAGRIGGIIFFGHNIPEPKGDKAPPLERMRSLVALFQSRAEIPLFVSVDQEGGRVQRLKEQHGVEDTPSAKILGKGEPSDTRAIAKRLGRRLRSAGINLDFAPSLDVDVNSQSPAIGLIGRSFSADPKIVAEHGRAFAEGLYAAGIIPCYKHFPGHGSAAGDTHHGLTDITATWKEGELEPYRAVFQNSPPAMVMPGHIVHKKITGDMPASLSETAVTGLLRKELGWDGVVVTDDLHMQAIDGRYKTKEAVRLAVNAGVDVLLFGNNLRHDPKEGRKAHAMLMELVREGAISKERIAESYVRIMKLKDAAGLLAPRR